MITFVSRRKEAFWIFKGSLLLPLYITAHTRKTRMLGSRREGKTQQYLCLTPPCSHFLKFLWGFCNVLIVWCNVYIRFGISCPSHSTAFQTPFLTLWHRLWRPPSVLDLRMSLMFTMASIPLSCVQGHHVFCMWPFPDTRGSSHFRKWVSHV